MDFIYDTTFYGVGASKSYEIRTFCVTLDLHLIFAGRAGKAFLWNVFRCCHCSCCPSRLLSDKG